MALHFMEEKILLLILITKVTRTVFYEVTQLVVVSFQRLRNSSL